MKLGSSATFTCVTDVGPNPLFYIYKNGNSLNPGGVFGSQTSLDEVSFYMILYDFIVMNKLC